MTDELFNDIATFQHDPLGYVLFAFPWGEGELKGKSIRKWQRDFLEDLGEKLKSGEITVMEAILMAITSGHGIGKMQSKSVMLYTPKGLVRWGDVIVGDYLFGRNGKPTKVLARHENGIKPSYKITFDDGSSTVAGPEHIWAVRGRAQRRSDRASGRSGEFIEMTTQQILEAGVLRSNGQAMARQWEIPRHEATHFPKKELPVHPYLLGAWLGNGGRNSSVITTMDMELIEHLRDIGAAITVKKYNDYSRALTVRVSGLKGKLRKLGIVHKYSYEKSIPEIYKTSAIEDREELLRGLLDTDGEAGKQGSISYSSTSHQLTEDVVWLARSLGGKARISKTPKMPFYRDKDGNKVPGRPCYRVTITMPHGFKSFYIRRRQCRAGNVEDRYLSRWISAIDYVGEEDSMCVTVEAEDGLYLTNDFIVTHNSALVAWLIMWAISTMEDTRGIITANTEAQLKTKTWSELAKWHRLSINKDWFVFTATALYSSDSAHEKTWRIDQVPWSENKTESFAGLHNEGKRILVIFDEGSAIPDKIWEVTEGALTDENTEIIWCVFGNPTRNTGRFRECFRRFKHRWVNHQIDSRDVEGTNKEQINKWIQDYGEDSDFVKVRVRGLFPSSSFKQFISTDDVDAAFGKHLREPEYEWAPKILTVDPAWEGDDEFVIGMRQGLAFKILGVYPKNDNDLVMAGKIAHLEDYHQCDAVFIDMGYGTGILSVGRTLKRNWVQVGFADKSSDPGCLNKRAEMWKNMRDWLKEGGAIPKDTVLYNDLISPETVPRMDGKIQLESKKDMKARGVPSPGRADALALSFAYPVQNAGVRVFEPDSGRMKSDWDPYAEGR